MRKEPAHGGALGHAGDPEPDAALVLDQRADREDHLRGPSGLDGPPVDVAAQFEVVRVRELVHGHQHRAER